MKNPSLFLIVAVIAGLFAGCTGEENLVGPESALAPPRPIVLPLGGGVLCAEPLTVPLIAGRNMNVGTVTVTAEAGEMRVEITTNGDWSLQETQVAVGPNLQAIPQTRTGRPKVGRFPLKAEHDPPVTTFTYVFDPADYRLGPGDAYVAVHADLSFSGKRRASTTDEGAWAEGLRFPGAGWAMYFLYPLSECEVEGECGLGVLTPNGGEVLCSEFPTMVTWNSSECGDMVVIELLLDGALCSTVAESVPNTGEYEWIVGFCGGEVGPYHIRVRDLASGVGDDSDAHFDIIPCGGGEKR